MVNPHGIEIVPAITTIYEPWSDTDEPINFNKICEASLSGDMNPLDEDAILHEHWYGVAAWEQFVSGHGVLHEDVVSYAAVTGFANHPAGKLAEIGGVLTIPIDRGKGYGAAVVSKVIALASSEEAIAEHGHRGFIAKCTAENIGFFVAKLGFQLVETEGPTHIAVKLCDSI